MVRVLRKPGGDAAGVGAVVGVSLHVGAGVSAFAGTGVASCVVPGPSGGSESGVILLWE